MMPQKTISAIIICHNYGQYLEANLKSILNQTRVPDEIIVVDDNSSDQTSQVASKYAKHKISYLRCNFNNPFESRKFGIKRSTGDIICCIDADDTISPAYIECALKKFATDPQIGIVYSDCELVGAETGLISFPTECTSTLLENENYIHSGALFLRDAACLSGILDRRVPVDAVEDWFFWRCILDVGYRAVKQDAIYYYTKHKGSRSSTLKTRIKDFPTLAGLSAETVMLFIPLSGRLNAWYKLSQFLIEQDWPHNQIKLFLLNTSDNQIFSSIVRHWCARCDYQDIHYVQLNVGPPGLADADRTDSQTFTDVNIAMGRIYNLMARNISTNYVWIVEDDIVPPLDACRRLLRAFDHNTLSVTGAYQHRYRNGYVCWKGDPTQILEGGSGIQDISGNGFGCVLIRGGILRDAVFPASMCYDVYFYQHYSNFIPRIDWSVECEHLSALQPIPVIQGRVTQVEFDEEYYLVKNPDVKHAIDLGELPSGFAHFMLFGQKEGRTAKKITK